MRQLFDPENSGIVRTRSQLTESLLRIDGKPVSLQHYPMFRAVYDGGFKKTLLMTCRQVGKSTTLSNFEITESLAIPFFKNFFIAPSAEQTQKYSTGRVGKTILYSPLVKKHFVGPGAAQRVLSRVFANGSEINFSYAEDDADRCRGVSADRLCLDEVQDILLEAVLPVVKECLANSEYQYEMYCGTPKTFENGIQKRWEESSQTEWAMKCPGCSKYSIIRSEKQFGKDGPVCLKCQSYLNPREGQWVDMNPRDDWKLKGFHISRPMMPKSVPAAWPEGPLRDKAREGWEEIMEKLEGRNAYAISLFRNEVIGVSDSQGRRIITIEQLRAMCDGPPIAMKPDMQRNMKGVVRIAAGIDWSGGGTEMKSRTVLTILGKVGNTGKLRLLYFKIFPGTNPVDEVQEIGNTLQMYNIDGTLLIGGDRGEGNMPTDMLRKRFTDNPRRVMKFHYTGNMSSNIKWNDEGKFYVIHRTHSIDSLMSALSRQEFQFPHDPGQNIMDIAFQDILNEYEEVTKEGRKYWDHAPTNPDDFLHALNFARLAMQISTGEVNLTS